MINVLPIAVALLLLAVSAMAAGKAKPQHPELSAQEKLIACADCHREATPEIEQQWHNSVHGIAMVKCYECHGTYETFAVTPSRQTCAVCHADMLKKCPQDRPCWECHVPHTFKLKKAQK